jgi:hypothetical protein
MTKKMKFSDMDIQQILNKGIFTEEEINEAIARTDLDNENTKTKTKTLKLQMDNLKDRLLAVYLEDKGFTEIVWRALEIYKTHFDAEVLLQEKLDRIKTSRAEPSIVSSPQMEEVTMPTVNESSSKETAKEEVDAFDISV